MSPNLGTSLLMIAAFVIFSAMAILARAISDDIPVIQLVLIRQALSMVLLVPLFCGNTRISLGRSGWACTPCAG